MVAGQIVLHHFHRFELFETCFLCNLVLTVVSIVFEVTHIGDVAHITHFVAEMTQIAEEDVEGDGRTRMAKMTVAIDGRAADIHAHPALMQGLEKLLGARQGVIDGKIVVYHKFSLIHDS